MTRWAIAGAIVVGLAGLAYAKTRASAPDTGIQSIAVVPLSTSAADSSDYFADGIIETLIAALSKVPGLEVRPSASSLALRGRKLSDADIGQMLNVGSILHVSVRRSAGMMRIIVDLSRVRDAKVLWTDQQERPLSDVFAVQDSIANSTASALAIHLGAHDRVRVASFGTQSLEAYDYYLRARHEMARFDEASLHSARALLDSALIKDPRYAQAYASIAEIWINLSDDWISPREGYTNALAAAKRALDIDSTAAWARGMYAVASVTLNRDYRHSLVEAERAFRGDSLQAGSVYPYSGVLSMSGYADSSFVIGRRALALDPVNPLYALVTAWGYAFVGRLDSASAYYRRALALEPRMPPAVNGLAEVLLEQGKPGEAFEVLKDGVPQLTGYRSTQARILAALGRVAEARQVTASLVADASHRYVSGDYIAAAYVALGKHDEAMQWLERANDERSQWMLYARSDPRWIPLRNDQRFKALLAKIGSP